MMGPSFMPGVRDSPSDIVSIIKMLDYNIKNGLTPFLPDSMMKKIEIILSMDPTKDQENISEFYDDLLDDFIEKGIESPL